MNPPIYLHITVYTHFVKVSRVKLKVQDLVLEYAGLLDYFKINRRVHRGKVKVTRVLQGSYAGVTLGPVYHFSIFSLKEFIHFLANNGVAMENIEFVVDNQVSEYQPLDTPLRSTWELYDYQKEIHKYVVDDNHVSKLVTLNMGKGKLENVDNPIRVPGGWKRMGDIVPGDRVVARDGSYTEVLNVYPQGVVDMYLVTMEDGRSVEVGLEHLWKITTTPPQIATTEFILNNLTTGYSIDLPQPEELPEADLLIPPYIAGVILSIGEYALGNCYLNNPNPQTLDRVHKLLPWVTLRRIFNTDQIMMGYSNDIRGLDISKGIHDLNLGTYTIPQAYMEASPYQKQEFMEGFTQSDITQVFSQSEIRVDMGISLVRLARSMGHYAKVSKPYKKYTLEHKQGVSYVDIYIDPRPTTLGITNITQVQPAHGQCISVDHPEQLYITGEYIVTHNTVTALSAISEINIKTAVVVLAKYVEKWVTDIPRILDVDPDDITSVAGGVNLAKLLNGEIGADSKFLVISNRTMANYIKDYENNPTGNKFKAKYAVKPEDMWQAMGVGVCLVDEVHQEFYSVSKMIMYSKLVKFIGLSGSLVSLDPIMSRLYETIFPRYIRHVPHLLDKYTVVTPIRYRFNSPNVIRVNYHGSPNYSHNRFEASIMSSSRIEDNYFKMILHYVKVGYIDRMRPGERLAVYCSSVEMCTRLSKRIQKSYPDLSVTRYTGGDPTDNVLLSDIRVTTILSAGTLVDIKSLITVIQTISIQSIQANTQVLGRLRRIEGRTTRFYYPYCLDIPTQVSYHESRITQFEDRVSDIIAEDYPTKL